MQQAGYRSGLFLMTRVRHKNHDQTDAGYDIIDNDSLYRRNDIRPAASAFSA